jgi:hypothetical protein
LLFHHTHALFQEDSWFEGGKNMSRLHINIKDDKKVYIVLDLLKELPFVEIEDSTVKTTGRKRKGSLTDLFGMWEHRKITLNEIREKAWNRR